MKKRSISHHSLSLACFLLLASAFPRELLNAPPKISNERGSIVVSESNGKARWTADWTMEPYTVDSHPAVRFTEHGRGQYSPFPTDVQWSSTAVWDANVNFRPLRFEKTFTDAKGQVLAVERKSFDQKTHTMTFERSGAKENNGTRRLHVPEDTLTVEGVAGVLRGLPFEQGSPFPIHLVSNEPKLYSITIESRGRERLRTPLGDQDCYKVEFVPNVGILGFAKAFVGKTYFWFTVAPPHFWVKYEGYENGLGTPHITMELRTYEPKR